MEEINTITKKPFRRVPGPIPYKLGTNRYIIGMLLWVKKGDMVRPDGIYRDGILKQLEMLGYMKRYVSEGIYQYILVQDNILDEVTIPQIRDAISYEIDKVHDINIEYKGLTFEGSAELQKDIFLRNSPSIFNDAILGHLPNHTAPILHDDVNHSYFAFQNQVIKTDENGITPINYADMNNVCVWRSHMIKRPFTYTSNYLDAQMAEFIYNVTNSESDRVSAFQSGIGYLLHHHSNPTTSRAVIGYDEQISGKNEPAGGSGKGVLNQAVGQLRNVSQLDGKKYNDRNTFSFQSVTRLTQIINLDDVRPDFDFLSLNSSLTDGWQVEPKHKPVWRFEPHDNPKTYITSNTILRAEGTTASRRQFILEFAPFYSNLVKQNIEPIIHVHGCTFFSDDWDQDEWNRFYSYMMQCSVLYHREGLQFYDLRSVNKNKLLQMTSDDFAEYIEATEYRENIEFNISAHFADFKEQYFGNDYDFKQRTFTNWLKIYALTKDWKLNTKRSNGNTIGKFTIK